MPYSVTLNIHYALQEDIWQKVQDVYCQMPGWIGYLTGECPYWFGTEENDKDIVASVEPSGLVVDAEMESRNGLNGSKNSKRE